MLSSKEVPWPKNIVGTVEDLLFSMLVLFHVADYIRRHRT